eukprot:COSAG01_NODE_25405_length_746_cov_1.030912_1_plen_163_part_10
MQPHGLLQYALVIRITLDGCLCVRACSLQYGLPGGTTPLVESVRGDVDFFVKGTATAQEINAVEAILAVGKVKQSAEHCMSNCVSDCLTRCLWGQPLAGLPPTFTAAVALCLIKLLAALPRPIFPSALLPLAGECGGQVCLFYKRNEARTAWLPPRRAPPAGM